MADVLDEVTIKKEIEDTDSTDVPQTDNQSNQKQQKVTLWLKPTGNAPIIKQKKWTIERNTQIAKIMGFLKGYMSMDSGDSVFLYVNQSFAPSPDHEVGNVYDCFNINGKLVLHYSTSPAWG